MPLSWCTGSKATETGCAGRRSRTGGIAPVRRGLLAVLFPIRHQVQRELQQQCRGESSQNATHVTLWRMPQMPQVPNVSLLDYSEYRSDLMPIERLVSSLVCTTH